MLIDTHCHLDACDFDADRDQMLTRARMAGVQAFVVPATDAGSFERVEALAGRHRDIAPALGIHPLYVNEASAADLELLDERLARIEVVAIGEIGLDGYVADVDPVRQERFFIAQLRLARKHGLPVILHVRRAVDTILKQLRRIEVPGGIAHAFNGSRQQADQFLALGFKLGYGGASTFDGSKRIRRLAAELPDDALVLETDSPDMPPAWAQGGRNEPANIVRIADTISALRCETPALLARATARNACAALPRLRHYVPDMA